MQRNARYNGYTICPIERCFPLPGVSLPPGQDTRAADIAPEGPAATKSAVAAARTCPRRWPTPRETPLPTRSAGEEKRLFHPRRAANAIAGALAAEGAASK